VPVEHLLGGAAQDRFGEDGRAGAEVERAGHAADYRAARPPRRQQAILAKAPCKRRRAPQGASTATGASRLEDVRGETLMVQIASKSMLLNVKSAQRIVDDCVCAKQRAMMAEANAAKAAAQAGPSKAATEAGTANAPLLK